MESELDLSRQKHWRLLCEQIYGTADGFDLLTDENKMLFAVVVLHDEVLNGGFHQYFTNSSANYHAFVLRGLTVMGADRHLDLVRQAAEVAFGGSAMPDRDARLLWLDTGIDEERDPWRTLSQLDSAYYALESDLYDFATAFAVRHDLFASPLTQ